MEIKLRKIELLVGFMVIITIASVFLLALKASNLGSLGSNDSYYLITRFDNIGGLTENSSVTASGVKVGKVASIYYDAEQYQAVVKLKIEKRFNTFSIDSTASILTSGLLGEKYIGLETGAEDDYLQDGDEVRLTQSALILEQIIGQFLFSKADE